MKKGIIFLVGGAAVAGVVAYGMYRYIHGKKETVIDPSQKSDVNPVDRQTDHTTKPDAVAELNRTKSEVISSLKATRQEAAQAIEGSLNTIFNGTTEEAVTENTEALNQISADLEDLLK